MKHHHDSLEANIQKALDISVISQDSAIVYYYEDEHSGKHYGSCLYEDYRGSDSYVVKMFDNGVDIPVYEE